MSRTSRWNCDSNAGVMSNVTKSTMHTLQRGLILNKNECKKSDINEEQFSVPRDLKQIVSPFSGWTYLKEVLKTLKDKRNMINWMTAP